MNLTGELVLVRNQAVRACEPRDQVLRPLVQRLDKVTAELQDAVLRTRMQPVSVLFSKFPRLVRDLARQLGKQIELLMSGTEVELDKNVLEWLSDPLTHLVRNCCDHGIEPPERRKQAGKPVEGRVFLNARHAGGQIVIEIRDDGRGIDPQAIRRKAVQLGMRTQAEAARLTDQEVLSLVLLPGFSTAQVVTDLSGRGVGLDVVKTNLDRLGGVLEIASESGQGTALTLSVPLTLAIIPCLLVVVEGSRYALPQKDLEELICLQKDQARLRIESAFDQEVVRLRDRLVPLVRLTEVLARPAPFTASTKAEIVRKYQNQSAAKQFLAVVKVGSQRLGLILDEILTTEEIVVQPLHAGLRRLACFAGSTILGDGQVALILSTEGVARHAGVNFELAHETAPRLPGEVPLVESQVVLLFQYGPKEQLAVPLSMIRRIQRIHARDIERVGDREFITLEGNSTPLLRLDRLLPVSSCPDLETMLVLLPNNLPRPVAVILSAVVDTETLSVDLDTRAFQANGVLGTAVLRGRMTLFLDLYRLADQMALPAPEGTPLLPARKRRILLIEDTAFFRELVKGYLQGAGYEVVTAVHGAEGLERLQEQPFDLVVSDIEMPVMDGWTLARTMRSLPEGRNMPLLALTTLSSEAHRDKARECGFDRYEVKLERDRFLESVAALLGKSS
jgi:two-component system chemotaxis sensor kinase CheA